MRRDEKRSEEMRREQKRSEEMRREKAVHKLTQ
jgi:hypothetical protein